MLNRICCTLNRWVEYSLSLLGILMALLVAVQVFCRYVLNGSLFWSEELARYMLVWLSFLGATVAYYRGLHPGVDVLVRRLSGGARKTSALLVHGLTICLALVMVIAGLEFAWFVRTQVSPALGIHKWIILLVIPASGLLLILYGCHFLFSIWRRSFQAFLPL